jgi:uncharacterized protein YsxB (DUF464 family)
MISISFKKGKNNLEIKAAGHALFNKKGSDVVCASVSTLIQSWCLSEKEICRADIETGQKGGSLQAKVINYRPEDLLLYKSLVLSLRTLERQYPGYIKIDLEDSNGGF